MAKTDMARFFSHLDLQRTLERVIRRAGLPIAFTQGFNPHMKISYASALATGTSSEGEFVDVELTEELAPNTFLDAVNAVSPAGLRVLEARVLPGAKGDSLTSLLTAAEYRLTLADGDLTHLPAAVDAFLAAPVVTVTKEGKTGPRQVDIRPQAYALEVTGPAELRAVVQTGPQGNLRPDDLVSGLKAVAPALGEVTLAQAHRLMLYRRDPESGALLEPWDL